MSVRAMRWTHNNQWMVTADHAGFIKYWQSNMNNVKMYQGHKEPIRGIRWASCTPRGGSTPQWPGPGGLAWVQLGVILKMCLVERVLRFSVLLIEMKMDGLEMQQGLYNGSYIYGEEPKSASGLGIACRPPNVITVEASSSVMVVSLNLFFLQISIVLLCARVNLLANIRDVLLGVKWVLFYLS